MDRTSESIVSRGTFLGQEILHLVKENIMESVVVPCPSCNQEILDPYGYCTECYYFGCPRCGSCWLKEEPREYRGFRCTNCDHWFELEPPMIGP